MFANRNLQFAIHQGLDTVINKLQTSCIRLSTKITKPLCIQEINLSKL